jgi:putative lipoic acid-binding regulatory protein
MMTETEETLLKFPCQFPLKVMGRRGDDFEAAVLTIVRKHVENLGEGAVRSRDSGKGKFTSLTVTFEAQSKQQLDALYRELHAHKLVLMLL